MTTRMLIDARHREETRVAVVKGNRIEEFDFESAERKQLKGNIYLAKVTRVEPSLQAAFVDYGGNRHGFLAFSEIHPDYYQIPKEDRDALLREEAEHAAEEEALRGDDDDDHDHDHDHDHEDDRGDEYEDEGDGAPADAERGDGEEGEAARPRRSSVGGGDDTAVEALRNKRMNLRRRYKIQDVIRRRQVLLVQVVKEERGNKGAALTTYLSLAGRYCVLMPNTSHGGGISRKISNASDRKRLKSIMAELNLPKTMGCIVRTAGLQRSKSEIKRDFDYLARLWDTIRETTLQASAPAEIYGDSDLIKRAIRDIYNRDIDEILVEGADGFYAARSFMKLLMPGHSRKITPYSDVVPLFQRFGVEEQLSAMYQPLVQLKSGGYLVINPTEALVSIDINSGRSTREHNIEQTALMTNLEAAHEIARQLRLRDMAGLVVIDFIDMENNSNNRKVEKAMKEALRNDRARIQVGRISSFGLFEMSRQRIRTGVLEASTRPCPHCDATGLVRTASSAGVSALRMLEDEAARGRGSRLCLRASTEAAFYVLNRKRAELAEIEDRYGVLIEILPDGSIEGARMSVESGGPPPAYPPKLPAPIVVDQDDDEEPIEDEEEETFESENEEEPERAERGDRPERGDREEGDGGGRRRRRRRRRGGRREEGEELAAGDVVPGEGEESEAEAAEDAAAIEEGLIEPVEAEASDDPASEEDGEAKRRRGRRGRRGGRRRAGEEVAAEATGEEEPVEGSVASDAAVEAVEEQAAAVDAVEPADEGADAPLAASEASPEAVAAVEEQAAPRARRRPRARKDAASEPVSAEADAAPAGTGEADGAAGAEARVQASPVMPTVSEPAVAPKARRPRRKKADDAVGADAAEPAAAEEVPAEPQPKPRRTRRKAEPAPEATPAAEPIAAVLDETLAVNPATDDDAATDAPGDDAATDAGGSPRRGWWQRTFGA
ncbi:Rne/Rng family ribonuclease [Sphingomonas profundi]|uniref:Rne/Rng family ribonuclease n=1 Tax=Alterirhizorhabdus profundi TaxID=2681549 RepID=UPI0018D0E1CC|nr:Rne/Rng family ribonuclease [Sphingomonas profundi]